jgi:hypothetical protein
MCDAGDMSRSPIPTAGRIAQRAQIIGRNGRLFSNNAPFDVRAQLQ